MASILARRLLCAAGWIRRSDLCIDKDSKNQKKLLIYYVLNIEKTKVLNGVIRTLIGYYQQIRRHGIQKVKMNNE